MKDDYIVPHAAKVLQRLNQALLVIQHVGYQHHHTLLIERGGKVGQRLDSIGLLARLDPREGSQDAHQMWLATLRGQVVIHLVIIGD